MNELLEEAIEWIETGLTDELTELIEKHPDLVHAKRQHDQITLLHMSVHCDDYEICSILLKAGADVNARSRNGCVPLHFTSCGCYSSRPDIVDLLVLHGADVNSMNNDGRTILMDCCDSRKNETAERLVKHGADINLRNPSKYPCLVLTIIKNDRKTFWLLLKHGAYIDVDIRGLSVYSDNRSYYINVITLLRIRIAICSGKSVFRIGSKSKLRLLPMDAIRKLLCEFL